MAVVVAVVVGGEAVVEAVEAVEAAGAAAPAVVAAAAVGATQAAVVAMTAAAVGATLAAAVPVAGEASRREAATAADIAVRRPPRVGVTETATRIAVGNTPPKTRTDTAMVTAAEAWASRYRRRRIKRRARRDKAARKWDPR
jgi:hypothetical protein